MRTVSNCLLDYCAKRFKRVEKPRKTERKKKEVWGSEERKKERKMMKRRRRSWMMLLLISSLFNVVLSVTTTTTTTTNNNRRGIHSSISALFVLGDSSVSCGDNTFFNTFYSTAHSSPYPCLGSETRLLPYLLAEKLALPSVPPFYRQNGTIEGLVSGLNFGSSQATIMSTGSLGFQTLNQQLRQVYETLQMLQLELGLDKAQHLIRSSLFYISLGKDDYVQLFLHNSSCKRCKYRSGAFTHILVKQMIRVVKDLYNANARKIICMGIAPLGCAPRALWESFNSTGHKVEGYCVDEINELVLEYNSMLSEQLVDLNYKLFDAQIIFCDIYQGMMEIIMDPIRYGFSNVKRACCGLGRYGGMVGCLSKEIACNDPRSHIWWDFYNPTEGINSLLANWTWSGEPLDICHPINIERLV